MGTWILIISMILVIPSVECPKQSSFLRITEQETLTTIYSKAASGWKGQDREQRNYYINMMKQSWQVIVVIKEE